MSGTGGGALTGGLSRDGSVDFGDQALGDAGSAGEERPLGNGRSCGKDRSSGVDRSAGEGRAVREGRAAVAANQDGTALGGATDAAPVAGRTAAGDRPAGGAPDGGSGAGRASAVRDRAGDAAPDDGWDAGRASDVRDRTGGAGLVTDPVAGRASAGGAPMAVPTDEPGLSPVDGGSGVAAGRDPAIAGADVQGTASGGATAAAPVAGRAAAGDRPAGALPESGPVAGRDPAAGDRPAGAAADSGSTGGPGSTGAGAAAGGGATAGGRLAGRAAHSGRAAAGGRPARAGRRAARFRRRRAPTAPESASASASASAPPDPGGVRRPKRTLAALALGLCAAGLAIGSGADFTARTANPSNVFSAGSLAMENSKDGTAIFSPTGMKPGGAPKTGIVDIKNTGSIDGRFTVSRDQLTNTDLNADNPIQFASKVVVAIVDCGRFTTVNTAYGPDQVTPVCGDADDHTVYLGPLSIQNGDFELGTYAPGEKHRYEFEGSLDQSAGNEFAGDSASARYVFDAKQTP